MPFLAIGAKVFPLTAKVEPRPQPTPFHMETLNYASYARFGETQ